MTDTLVPTRITGDDTAPAVFKSDWLPDDAPFPELAELHSEYQRLYEQRKAESAKVWAASDAIDAAKRQRETDLREAMANGTPTDAVEDNSETLKAELDKARERSTAAAQAFVDHINHAIEVVLEHRPEWQAEITQHEADIDAEVVELQAQLVAATNRRGSFFRLDHWLERTAAGAEFAPAHIPYGDIPAPPSTDPAVMAAEQQRRTEESYAGGMGGTTKITDEQSRQREADHVPSGGVMQTEDQSSGVGA